MKGTKAYNHDYAAQLILVLYILPAVIIYYYKGWLQ